MAYKDYLVKEEIERAIGCLSVIQDNLNAIRTELMVNEKPYKNYLREKIQPCLNDILVLNEMCKRKDEHLYYKVKED